MIIFSRLNVIFSSHLSRFQRCLAHEYILWNKLLLSIYIFDKGFDWSFVLYCIRLVNKISELLLYEAWKVTSISEWIKVLKWSQLKNFIDYFDILVFVFIFVFGDGNKFTFKHLNKLFRIVTNTNLFSKISNKIFLWICGLFLHKIC